MRQIHEAVQALEKILAAILDFVEKTGERKKKFTRQIPQGQYAYCKYLEMIGAGESRNKMQRVDSANTISLHHRIVGGVLKIAIN